ncbi:cytochrome bd-I oxidase subunit CydX [Thalassotalea profundi]|uniref:Cyd operon protein YbgT n=1 Tax=Thalassotalea profundi TaxID=2036687 RepID=A0ABQ3IBI7_9GAMM|nr:cytochrome bd-I oxidase subunit CydX [Thalassotalea profundi]GHE77878.1 cyd operon protein YbgT [Thalassotalea profundi]
MWYFSWILGVLLAVSLGIINVMWYEMEQHKDNVADDQIPED